MRDSILQLLARREAEHGFRIVYACESGSRAWGFASADSDYDVRFIYAWPQEQYLGIYDPTETLNYGVDADLLDVTGWDLRKALALFRKANGSLMEWLFSPVVYRQDEAVMDEWRALVPEYFLPRNSAAHYLGLCKQIWGKMRDGEASDSTTAKKYLYVLRSLLASRFVLEKQQRIPVRFDELRAQLDLDSTIADAIEDMINAKASGKEKDTIPRHAQLDAFITTELDRVDSLIGELPSEPGSIEELNAFFRKTIRSCHG